MGLFGPSEREMYIPNLDQIFLQTKIEKLERERDTLRCTVLNCEKTVQELLNVDIEGSEEQKALVRKMFQEAGLSLPTRRTRLTVTLDGEVVPDNAALKTELRRQGLAVLAMTLETYE